jgi:hypothetical protein
MYLKNISEIDTISLDHFCFENKIEKIDNALSCLFENFTPITIKPNMTTPEFESPHYKAVKEQDKKSNALFYKRGQDGKWKKRKEVTKKNIKNRPRWRGAWGGSQAITKTRKQ